MKKKPLHMRIEIGRWDKLHHIAESRKKTMTQLVEDWIDSQDIPNTTQEE